MPMRFLTADDRFLVILLTMVLWEGERFCDALFCAERATHQSIRLCGCAREQRNHRTQAADVASQRLGSLVVQKDKNVLAATQPKTNKKIPQIPHTLRSLIETWKHQQNKVSGQLPGSPPKSVLRGTCVCVCVCVCGCVSECVCACGCGSWVWFVNVMVFW